MPGIVTVQEALDLGLSATRVRANDLDATVWGVRSTFALGDLRSRCAALLRRMPATAFLSHVTALALHGVPTPIAFDGSRIDVAMPSPARGPHAAGIRGHRLAIAPGDVILQRGLRMAVPGRAWIDSALRLPLADLVALGDGIVRHVEPLVDFDELMTRIERHPRHLGGRKLRTAISLIDGAAESYPESLLRVAITRAGFPPPLVNRSLVVAGNRFRPDLMFERARVIVEYQGDYHRDPAQWRADLRRRMLLEAHGWTVIETTWSDIQDPANLFGRLRSLGVR